MKDTERLTAGLFLAFMLLWLSVGFVLGWTFSTAIAR